MRTGDQLYAVFWMTEVYFIQLLQQGGGGFVMNGACHTMDFECESFVFGIRDKISRIVCNHLYGTTQHFVYM